MEQQLTTLDALLKDVSGNLSMGNSKNAAGYLHSMSLLSAAMARVCQQRFELGVIEELEEMAPGAEVSEGLQTKRSLNERQLELAELEVKLLDYLASVSSACFTSHEDAAACLDSVAEEIRARGPTKLFPKPATIDEVKAWAAKMGYTYVEEGSAQATWAEQKPTAKPRKLAKANGKTKVRHRHA